MMNKIEKCSYEMGLKFNKNELYQAHYVFEPIIGKKKMKAKVYQSFLY